MEIFLLCAIAAETMVRSALSPLVLSGDTSPEGDIADVNGSEEGSSIFLHTRSAAAPAFHVTESVLYQMTRTVDMRVISALDEAILLWRDHRLHALRFRLLKDSIGVVAATC